jgi:hypothetical protein
MRFSGRILVIAITFLVGGSVVAQPLADRLPDDALLYVGWRGANDPGPGYANSRLKAFVDASQVPDLIRETLPRVLDKLATQDRSAAVLRDVLFKLGPAFWENPTAIYVGPVDGLPINPTPRMALLCQAGPKAAQLKKDINDYLDQIPQQQFIPVVATESDGIVAVVLGNVTPDLSGKTNTTLAHKKEFLDAMGQVGKDPVAAVYVDFEGIHHLVDQALAAVPDAAPKWQMISGTLGLEGLKRAAMTSGFDGRDWSTQTFVAAPAPRAGILSLLDAPPLSDETLKAIPQSSTMVFAGNVDFAKYLDLTRKAVAKLDPSAPQKIDTGLAMAGVVIGINLEQDLLKPLGDQWVMYNAPSVGGAGPLGFVIMNHCRDAKRLESALAILERLANTQINANTRAGEPRPNIVTATIDGVNVHYLNTPFVTPAWALDHGNLYFALFPQTVVAAAHAATAAGDHKSILDNPEFVAMRDRLGGQKASTISFYDLPKSAPIGYPYVLMLVRSLGVADMFGMQTPAAVFPSLEKITPLLTPAGGVAWSDEQGMHAKAVTPFPGAEVLAGPEVLLLNGAGLIVPAIGKSYEARRAAVAPTTSP